MQDKYQKTNKTNPEENIELKEWKSKFANSKVYILRDLRKHYIRETKENAMGKKS